MEKYTLYNNTTATRKEKRTTEAKEIEKKIIKKANDLKKKYLNPYHKKDIHEESIQKSPIKVEEMHTYQEQKMNSDIEVVSLQENENDDLEREESLEKGGNTPQFSEINE